MFEYYCRHCKKLCEFDELELEEQGFEGDWVEVHPVCGEVVMVRPAKVTGNKD